MGERGSVLPLVAVLMVFAGVVAASVAELGGAAVSRAKAQTAADAAALAGAAGGGQQEAARIAAANGGRLVSYDEGPPGDVQVTVSVGAASARARAARTPWCDPGELGFAACVSR